MRDRVDAIRAVTPYSRPRYPVGIGDRVTPMSVNHDLSSRIILSKSIWSPNVVVEIP